MIKIEQKKIKDKPYNYLIDRVVFLGKIKKIQVYLGKIVPKDLSNFYSGLYKKELIFVKEALAQAYDNQNKITLIEQINLEKARLQWKYAKTQASDSKVEKMWLFFAIQFIFESNAIEGSRLKASEVDAIIRKRYIKKNLKRAEVQEVENSIKAFDFLRSKVFKLNQRSVVNLHALITDKLDIPTGYKKHKIIVNNKNTTMPGEVRSAIRDLLTWYKKAPKSFETTIVFHQRFEHIHPFEDGNGRTGRMLLIWMLMEFGYGIILFKHSNRNMYFSALDSADEGRNAKLLRYSMKAYKKTVEDFIERFF